MELKLVLEANGFVELKVGKNKDATGKAIYSEIPINEYVITNLRDVRENDAFALFTGTETVEVKDKTILEVGPGTGNLTSALIENKPKKIRK